MQYLFVVCGAFSALFCLLSFSRKNKNIEHWYLGSIFLLVTVNCLFVFEFTTSSKTYYEPVFSELNYAIPLLYGPLLWFYSKAMTIKDYSLNRWDYLHFLPFFIFFLIILIPVFSSHSLPTQTQLGYPLIKLVTAPFYLFAVIRIIREYHKKFLEEYSYEQEVNLLWMNWIVTGAVVLWMIGLGSYLYNLFNEKEMILLYDVYTLSFLGLYLFGLAFVAVRHTDLFSSVKSHAQNPAKFVASNTVIAETSQLDADNYVADQRQLLTTISDKEPYLDPLLTLDKLSEISGIPSYRLTKLLKIKMNSSFYEFINTHRVAKVKELLKEGRAEQLSILGVAEESGFNSKASFNRIFKKATGLTPSAYLKSLQN